MLTRELVDWFGKAYAPPGTNPSDLRLSPLLAQDFADLPPAFVLTAGFDPLRDEGRAYADRLIDAGVKTTYVNYPGTIHGFFSMTRFLQQGIQGQRRSRRRTGGTLRNLGQQPHESDRLVEAFQGDALVAGVEPGQ